MKYFFAVFVIVALFFTAGPSQTFTLVVFLAVIYGELVLTDGLPGKYRVSVFAITAGVIVLWVTHLIGIVSLAVIAVVCVIAGIYLTAGTLRMQKALKSFSTEGLAFHEDVPVDYIGMRSATVENDDTKLNYSDEWLRGSLYVYMNEK